MGGYMSKRKLTVLLAFFLVPFFLVSIRAYASEPDIIRLGGRDRYGTAIKVSQDGFTSSRYVVIASGQDFPDALCAAPLAKKYNAPILLTQYDALRSDILSEIQRLGVQNAFVVGGKGVISGNVESQLTSLGISCSRIAGDDRYETSSKVAQIIGANNGVVLTAGENFPDALSIAAVAAAKQMPILLTDKYAIPPVINSFIHENDVDKYYAVGGTGVISDSALYGLQNVIRLGGSNRYETNLSVLNEFSAFFNFSNVYLTTGEDYADALGGSAAAAEGPYPVVLTDGRTFQAIDLIQSRFGSISMLKILGGPGIISDAIVNDLLSVYKEVLGYAVSYYSGDNYSYNSLVSHSPLIDYTAVETFSTDGLGNIKYNVPDNIVNFSNANNIMPLALVTNYFDGGIAKTLLESPANRNRLITNLQSALKTYNYKGVNIDLEGVYSYDRPYYSAFMKDLYSTLHPLGYYVTVSIPAKVWDNPNDGWSGAFDYAEIGKWTDRVAIMTYDEHWSGGSPGPVASINWVQNVSNYALTILPVDKVMLGIAAYGYDWPSDGSKAKAYSIPQAYNVAASYGAEIKWDDVSKSPYYNYTDSAGIFHTVWFENGISLGYKLDIVNSLNLRGIAIWRLGLDDSNFWTTISNKFNR
jgi:Predicted glycosyl hydrolase